MVYEFIKHFTGHGAGDLDVRNVIKEVLGVRGTNLAMDDKGFTQQFIDKIDDIASKIWKDPNLPVEIEDVLDHVMYKSPMNRIWPWDN